MWSQRRVRTSTSVRRPCTRCSDRDTYSTTGTTLDPVRRFDDPVRRAYSQPANAVDRAPLDARLVEPAEPDSRSCGRNPADVNLTASRPGHARRRFVASRLIRRSTLRERSVASTVWRTATFGSVENTERLVSEGQGLLSPAELFAELSSALHHRLCAGQPFVFVGTQCER